MITIELNRNIEEAKTYYELSKTEEEALYYKAILKDLRNEKKEIFNRSW